MQNVSHCQPNCQGPPQNAVHESLQQASRLQLAAAASERSADITIMTDDADKVTLSVDSRIKALALTYRENTESSAGRSDTRAELLGIDVEREVELSVQGELDEQERGEIRQVLKAVFKMVKNFLAGRYDGTMEAVASFGELGTISEVTAEFEVREAAAYVSRSSSVQTDGPGTAGATSLRQRPLPDPDRTWASAPAQPAAAQAPGTGVDGPARTAANAVSEKMAELVRDSGIDPATVKKPVDELFGRLMRRFLEEGPFGFRKMQRLRAIMEAFARRMENLLSQGDQGPPDSDKSDTEVLRSPKDAAAEQTSPQGLFTVQTSFVNVQARLFERSLSFSFEYSADESGRAAEDDFSIEA